MLPIDSDSTNTKGSFEVSEQLPSDERFSPSSWESVQRIVGWRPGSITYAKKLTPDEARRREYRQAYWDFKQKEDEMKRKFYGI
jgi:hypothetical protein